MLTFFLPHQSNVMDHSWPLSMDHMSKNRKPCLYVHNKSITRLPRPSNPSVGKWKSISFIVHQSLSPPKVIMIPIIMEIIWFTLNQSWWLQLKIVKAPISSQRLEILCFTFQFPVLFLCTDHYTHTSRNSDDPR